MKLISILFFLLTATASQNIDLKSNPQFPEFKKFMMRNYRVSQTQRSECKFEYASIVLETDQNNIITDYRVTNEVSDEMKNNFNFIKGYQFPKSYKINKRSVLFFLAINKQDVCSTLYESSQTPDSIIKQILLDIKRQLENNSRTIVIYDLVTIKVFKSSH
ncbi:MAG: hypothetical protein WBP45_13960 [Daejeonella sp.]